MGFVSILGFAHKLAGERVKPGDVAVDATVGNGNDTLFLAKAVGSKGCVYGFDIQQEALDTAGNRMTQELGEVHPAVLLLASHHQMGELLPQEAEGRVAAVMFNLGYLPGADHRTITTVDTTLPALDSSLALLRPGGIVTVVVYPGHEGGQQEADAVQTWAAALAQDRFHVLSYRFLNQKNNPPYLIAVEKRK